MWQISGQPQLDPPESSLPPNHSLSPTFSKVVLYTNNQVNIKQGKPARNSACKLWNTLGVETDVAVPATLNHILIHFPLVPTDTKFVYLFTQSHTSPEPSTLNRSWILGLLEPSTLNIRHGFSVTSTSTSGGACYNSNSLSDRFGKGFRVSLSSFLIIFSSRSWFTWVVGNGRDLSA